MNKPLLSAGFLLAGLLLMSGSSTEVFAQQNGSLFWSESNKGLFPASTTRDRLPENFRAVSIDFDGITSQLSAAPKRLTPGSKAGLLMSLPKPDGTSGDFLVWETYVMAPALAAKYPQIRTYTGQGIEDKTATLQLDISPAGLHAQILSANGIYYIDPYTDGNNRHYICYNKNSLTAPAFSAACGYLPQPDPELAASLALAGNSAARQMQVMSNGSELRTYRLALSCTGEYAASKGGTKAGALAAMVTSMNRVNGIYERELAVRMELIANNDTLIFLNGSTDPFTNNNGGTMLNQNQTVVDNLIGSANYDIGHVFSTGGGGIANLGVPCRNDIKAKGVTGLPNPTGDPFDVDYVAHEIGHQFGAEHTFNGNAGSCGGNGSSSTAYEPGSGTTIMAYAGICSSHNLTGNSSPYFHTASFDEIVWYTTSSFGNTCPVITPTGNTPPEVDPGDFYYIPYQTPFRLTANGFDPDNDPITYCFEQFDLGPFGHPNSPSGNAPIFRSFDPVSDNFRIFPKISTIVNNTQTIGERLPSYQRTMHFRVTVRDGRAGGGGVAYNNSTITVFAQNTGAPFKVTEPNTAVTWQGLETQTVTWDVANTTDSPIYTSYVNILLSTDGGYTFTDTLAAFVPNNGSYNITVPNISTNSARIVIFGAGNIFFDMSNANFTISQVSGIEEDQELASGITLFPNPTQGEFNLALKSDIQGDVEITVADVLGRQIKAATLKKGAATLNHAINLSNHTNGVYFVQVETSTGKAVKRIVKL